MGGLFDYPVKPSVPIPPGREGAGRKIKGIDMAEFAKALCPGFESAQLKLPSIEVVPFHKAVEAYKRVAEARATPKQVLAIS